MSPDDAQDIAVRQWRGGCSEKLDIHVRYSQRDEWIDIGLMPRKLLRKPRVNEDIPIEARTSEADEKEQADMRRSKAIGIKTRGTPADGLGALAITLWRPPLLAR